MMVLMCGEGSCKICLSRKSWGESGRGEREECMSYDDGLDVWEESSMICLSR